MKSHAGSIAIGILVSAAAASLLAQAPGQKPAAPAAPTQKAASPGVNRYIAIGCISREPQAAVGANSGSASAQYILTDSRGDKPTNYRLEGDAKQLDLHVGHTVEIAGPLSAPPAGGRGPNASALILKVTSLTWISTKCSK